jgi:hypothetical protein
MHMLAELATASSDDNLVVKAMTFHSCGDARARLHGFRPASYLGARTVL